MLSLYCKINANTIFQYRYKN